MELKMKYAIYHVEDLRKEFFKNAGKYEAWAEFKNKIQGLYEESEDKQ